MVLSVESRKERLGLPESVSLSGIPKFLTDMIKKSLRVSMVGQEVVVFVTGGTSERQLEVSWLLKEVTT